MSKQPNELTYIEETIIGYFTMRVFAPVTNACHNAAVAGAKNNYCGPKGYQLVYQGFGADSQIPSMRHFFRGFPPFLARELFRVSYKPYTVNTLQPWFKENTHSSVAPFLFAMTMAIPEVLVINPLDVMRIQYQAGNPPDYRFNTLSRGSLACANKHFIKWFKYMLITSYTGHWFQNDPLCDIATTSFITGMLTVATHPLERIKLARQYSTSAVLPSYFMMGRQIYREHGLFKGLGAGFLPRAAASMSAVAAERATTMFCNRLAARKQSHSEFASDVRSAESTSANSANAPKRAKP